MLTAPQFEAALRENGIPPRPSALEGISEEMRKEAPDLLQLSGLLGHDVALSAGVVKLANSALFRRQTPIRTIRDAMTMLGLDALSRVVACAALRQAFPGVRLERFWDASARTASIAAFLATRLRIPAIDREDAFTFAMFRDCGIGVLLLRAPGYEHVLRRANGEGVRAFTDIELDALPTTHAHVGAMLTQSWGLPSVISDAVRHHHDVRLLVASGPLLASSVVPGGLVAVTQVAELIYQRLTGLGETREWRKLGQAVMRRLALTESDLLLLEGTVRSDLDWQ